MTDRDTQDGVTLVERTIPWPRSLSPAAVAFERDVPLLTCYPGMPADAASRALEGRRGAVIEVFGDLNAPMALWGPIHEAWNAGCLVVLASRPESRPEGRSYRAR